MTIKYLFSGRKPAAIPKLRIAGSCVDTFDRLGTPVNIMDNYASGYRAKGTSIIDAERARYGDEIYPWSFGYNIGQQTEEDRWDQFRRWKSQTETPQTIDIIPRAEEIGYKISSRERKLGKEPGENALYVHDSIVNVPINLVGKYDSKAWDARYALTFYLNTTEGQLLDGFMNSKGYSLKHDIDYFASGGIRKNAIAAVRGKDNIFAFNKNFRSMIAKSAKAHNVDYEDEKFNTVAHELVHLYGINSEEELENLMLEFYSKIAEKEPEGYLIGVPKTIRSERNAYLRKSKIPLLRLAASGKVPFSKNIDMLVEQLYAEAINEGLSREEAEQYIEAFIEKTYGKAEKADYKANDKRSGKDYSEKTDKELSEEEIAKEAPNEESAEETAAEAESSESSE